MHACDLSASFHVSCQAETGENLTLRDGPVTNTDQALLGFTLRGKLRGLQPNFTSEFAPFIAADFAKRRMSGEKRLFKCKKSETSALQFILVKIKKFSVT